MAKIVKKLPNINPFGGIDFVLSAIKSKGLDQLIDNHIDSKGRKFHYSFSDLFLNLWSVFYCGGDCAEDLNTHFKDILEAIPENKVANADTVLKRLKELKTECETVVSKNNKSYNINHNDVLNCLNMIILIALKLLKKGNYYNVDFDNELLKTEKEDTKNSYKKCKGYFPGMATIDNKPIYFENRDGNMNVKLGQADLLKRVFKLLKDNEIKVDKARMDCGSYSKDIIDVVQENSLTFYIRASRCEYLNQRLIKEQDWKKEEINNIEYEVCSISYIPFSGEVSYRLVVSREKTNNMQLSLDTGDSMKYRCILTNDWDMSDKEVIEYYNKRGNEERVIDDLNNNFGWSKMPFSFMNENTVFLTVMMICKNIYTWLIAKFAKIFPDLKRHYRLKKFIFRFMVVPTQWIKHGGYKILKVFSNKPYELLRI